MPLSVLLLGLQTPDAVPAMAALKTCNRDEIRAITRAEPHRRTQFAAAAYAEQQAIAADRARLVGGQPASENEPSASGLATTALALAQLDARQKLLDDAKATERSWRDLYNELRADYLANCTTGKRDEK